MTRAFPNVLADATGRMNRNSFYLTTSTSSRPYKLRNSLISFWKHRFVWVSDSDGINLLGLVCSGCLTVFRLKNNEKEGKHLFDFFWRIFILYFCSTNWTSFLLWCVASWSYAVDDDYAHLREWSDCKRRRCIQWYGAGASSFIHRYRETAKSRQDMLQFDTRFLLFSFSSHILMLFICYELIRML